MCGDDGCGGLCGSIGVGNGCNASDPNNLTSCDGFTGQCVVATLGSCQLPYPLLGKTLNPGDVGLNSLDQEGLKYWMLNNTSTDTTEPIVQIFANQTLPAGYPTDGYTVPTTGIRVRIFLNSAFYGDSITSASNAIGTSDVSFAFTIASAQPQAFDAYLLGQDGSTGTDSRDMFFSLVQADCTDFSIGSPNYTPADQYESDDASPPGGYGSHIYSTGLSNGTYIIVASTYSQNNAGPSWLEVVFTDSTQGGPCTPICVGHKCGTNGCGGVCNVQFCSGNLECENGKCARCGTDVPLNCQKQGNANYFAPYDNENLTYTAECSTDSNNCGLSCGTCNPGSFCQNEMGICVAIPPCDFNVPVCTQPLPAAKKRGRNQAGPQYYCDSYCQWREINELLPDIVPNSEVQVMPSYLMEWKKFDVLSCAYDEKCVFGPGNRLILRFNTDIMNIGEATFSGPSPFLRPDLLEYAKCHQHAHMKGFARYDLRDDNGNIILQSTKQSYCVEATELYQFGPKVPCSSGATCAEQGLDVGWIDRYDRYLDCQWLDSTQLVVDQLMNKWYRYHISVNNGRHIVEYSYINNVADFPLFVPCPPDLPGQNDFVSYITSNPNVCCSRPGGLSNYTCDAPVGTCDQPAPKTSCTYPSFS